MIDLLIDVYVSYVMFVVNNYLQLYLCKLENQL